MAEKKIACIVLPTFREAENISALLPLIFAQSDKIPTHDLHVLVVDDDSPDGTAERVRDAMARYPNLHLFMGRRKGLGEAYKRGINHALITLAPDLILQMDADFQHDPAELPRFIRLSTEGYSLVIGSRFVPGGALEDFPWYRRMISLAGTWLVCRFAGLVPIHDCTSGYRCIRADLLPRCDLAHLSTRGYSFQSSLLCELLWNGARVAEIPITFAMRRNGKSKLSLRDQAEFLVNLGRLLLRRISRRALPAAPVPQASPGTDFASNPRRRTL
jgi:dolichol-phosphate mannosyltransferase